MLIIIAELVLSLVVLAKLIWSLIKIAWPLVVLVVLVYSLEVLISPLVVLVFPLAVLICPFVCPFVVLVCPLVELICPLVVSVCPLIVPVVLSIGLFITHLGCHWISKLLVATKKLKIWGKKASKAFFICFLRYFILNRTVFISDCKSCHVL